MSDDEDCDYMSEDFLEKCLPKDVTPGLQKTQRQKREHEVLKYQEQLKDEAQRAKRMKKGYKEMEQEARDEGLATKLDSSNKGFALLSKMGYKPGMRLGKDESGISDPIPVQVKEGRSGFGRDETMRKLAMEKCRIIEKRTKEIVDDFDPAAFRAQMREKHLARRLESDLYKAQKSCRDLDEKKEYEEPAESFFWPKIEKPRTDESEGGDDEEDEEEEEEEVFTVSEKLGLLLTYLRLEYFYCIYCGISYESDDDMQSNCPGPTREDHDE